MRNRVPKVNVRRPLPEVEGETPAQEITFTLDGGKRTAIYRLVEIVPNHNRNQQ